MQWFKTLPKQKQEIVLRGWGQDAFSNLVASLLIAAGEAAFRSCLPDQQQQSWLKHKAVRLKGRDQRAEDWLEHAYDSLHGQCSEVIARIDDDTGKHGEHAAKWVDQAIGSMEQFMEQVAQNIAKQGSDVGP